MEELIGEGTYAKVVRCLDHFTQQRVALKIFRSTPAYRDSAYVEVQILGALSGRAPFCAPMLSWFETLGHVAICMELYPSSVYNLMMQCKFAPVEEPVVASMALQVLYGLRHLHRRGVVHTDLKPENLVLRDASHRLLPGGPRSKTLQLVDPRILLIDFGSAVSLRSPTGGLTVGTKLITTRHYRAPEVVLGLGWGLPSDLWSLGCLMHELASGECLFMTHHSLEHMAMMERYLGEPLPSVLAMRAEAEAAKFFHRDGTLRWPDLADETVPHGVSMVQRLVPLRQKFARQPLLVAILERLLDYTPSTRATVEEAIDHPYFDSVRDTVRAWIAEDCQAALAEDDPAFSSATVPVAAPAVDEDAEAAPQDPLDVFQSSEFWYYFEPAVDPAQSTAEEIIESSTLPPVRAKNGRLFFFEEDPPDPVVVGPPNNSSFHNVEDPSVVEVIVEEDIGDDNLPAVDDQ